ncbi:uncharacterized protein LOC141969737 [Athene noctua]|uniref:uncharacterized protein LOC141969737 n=1 Tax=Athene noctua TaxID=126797 RepID=UPI003EB82958
MTPTLILLLLLVALRAQGAGAAPWRARALAVPGASGHSTAQPALVREDQGHPTEVSGGDGSAASQLRSRGEAQGDRTDVGTGRALPARRADPALELRWRRRRPQRAKDNAEVGQPSQPYSEVLQEILKELERAMPAQGNGHGSVEKEVFGEGGRQAVPASAERTGAVQPAGVPGASTKLRDPSLAAATIPRPWRAGPSTSAPPRAGTDTSSRWKTVPLTTEPQGPTVPLE